jgi:hypothetical protein
MLGDIPLEGKLPLDAKGHPIFFILPSDPDNNLQAAYDRKLARCEAAWHATGDPAFVSEAMILTHLHRQPPALWLSEAVMELAARRRAGLKGYATRSFNTAVRLMRYHAVLEEKKKLDGKKKSGTKKKGDNWDQAKLNAARDLKGTLAAAKSGTIFKDYMRVKRDLKKGRADLYHAPRTPNKKLRDALPKARGTD